MAFPTSIEFTPRYNKRAPGTYPHYTFGSSSDEIRVGASTLTAILTEVPAIAPAIPQINASSSGGGQVYTETPNLPGEFEYNLDYATGICTFNALASDKILYVDYYGTGSIVWAEDITTVQDACKYFKTDSVDRDGTIPMTGALKITDAVNPQLQLKYDPSNTASIKTSSTGTLQISTSASGGPALSLIDTDAAYADLIVGNGMPTPCASINFIKDSGYVNTHTILATSAENLGVISFQGAATSGYATGAMILGTSDGAAASGKVPGKLSFLTTPVGSATPVERLSIGNAGYITATGYINVTAASTAAEGLHIEQTGTSGAVYIKQNNSSGIACSIIDTTSNSVALLKLTKEGPVGAALDLANSSSCLSPLIRGYNYADNGINSAGFELTQSGDSTGIFITHSGAGKSISLVDLQPTTSTAIDITQGSSGSHPAWGDGYALNVTHYAWSTLVSDCINLNLNTTGKAINIVNIDASAGNALCITHPGSSAAIAMTNSGSGHAVSVVNSGTGDALHIVNTSATSTACDSYISRTSLNTSSATVSSYLIIQNDAASTGALTNLKLSCANGTGLTKGIEIFAQNRSTSAGTQDVYGIFVETENLSTGGAVGAYMSAAGATVTTGLQIKAAGATSNFAFGFLGSEQVVPTGATPGTIIGYIRVTCANSAIGNGYLPIYSTSGS